jgi:hypothetical protein
MTLGTGTRPDSSVKCRTRTGDKEIPIWRRRSPTARTGRCEMPDGGRRATMRTPPRMDPTAPFALIRDEDRASTPRRQMSGTRCDARRVRQPACGRSDALPATEPCEADRSRDPGSRADSDSFVRADLHACGRQISYGKRTLRQYRSRTVATLLPRDSGGNEMGFRPEKTGMPRRTDQVLRAATATVYGITQPNQTGQRRSTEILMSFLNFTGTPLRVAGRYFQSRAAAINSGS